MMSHFWLRDPHTIHVQGKFQQIYKPRFKRDLFTHYIYQAKIENRPHEAAALTFSGLKVNK